MKRVLAVLVLMFVVAALSGATAYAAHSHFVYIEATDTCQYIGEGQTSISDPTAGGYHRIHNNVHLGMPGMDGLQVARRLRSPPEPSTALLIALTGWDKDEDRRKTSDAGFDHHLAKPVAIDVLQELLSAMPKRSLPEATDV